MLSRLHYRDHIHHFANREMLEMFSFQVLRELAFGLVGIFVPVYLYTHGVSLFHILALFTLQSTLHGLVAFLVGRSVLLKIGLKHSFVLANFLFIASFITIQQGVALSHLLLWALFNGSANAIYASSFHSYLTLTIDDRSAGKEMGWLAIGVIMIDVITPFVGATCILLFGFSNMFAIGSLFVLASAIPLFFSSEVDISNQIHLKGTSHLKEFWRSKKKIAWSTVGAGFDG